MNFLLNIVCAILFPIVNAWNSWSEKQQRTYEEYQSEDAKLWRRIHFNRLQLEAEFAENARIAKWREKQAQKNTKALDKYRWQHDDYIGR